MLLVILSLPFAINFSVNGEDRIVVGSQCVLEDNCQSSTGAGDINPRNFAITCHPGQIVCSIAEMSCGRRRIKNYNEGNDGISTAGAHPWQAFVTYFGRYIGGGTLLDRRHVLTAAHKVCNVYPWYLRVYLGVWDPNDLSQTQVRAISAITVNKYYSNDTYKDDIAILRLVSPVIFDDSVGAACLPLPNQIFTNQACTVAGWGDSAFGAHDAGTQIQRQANVRVVDDDRCRRSMDQQNVNSAKYLDPYGQICAGGENGLDACTQDGGSPLICLDSSTNRYTVAGIVIWGKGCGQVGVYGVYTNVPYYRNWIDNALRTVQ